MEEVIVIDNEDPVYQDSNIKVQEGPARNYRLLTYSLDDFYRVRDIRNGDFTIEYKMANLTKNLFDLIAKEAEVKGKDAGMTFINSKSLFNNHKIMEKHPKVVEDYINSVLDLFFETKYGKIIVTNLDEKKYKLLKEHMVNSLKVTFSNYDFSKTFYDKAHLLIYMWKDPKKDKISNYPLQPGEKLYLGAFRPNQIDKPAAYWFFFSFHVPPDQEEYGYIHLHGWSGSLIDHFYMRAISYIEEITIEHPKRLGPIALSFTIHTIVTNLRQNSNNLKHIYMLALLFESSFNILTNEYGIERENIYRKGTQRETGDKHTYITRISEKTPEILPLVQYMWEGEIHIVEITDKITNYFKIRRKIGFPCMGCEIGQGKFFVLGQATEWSFCSQECFNEWWYR